MLHRDFSLKSPMIYWSESKPLLHFVGVTNGWDLIFCVIKVKFVLDESEL